LIEVENLTKYYGPQMAIEEVNFKVEKGEILGFLGPNAAGKTTTMRLLTCYMPATRGTAKVAGYDIFENSLEVRKRIGYLPENPPLYNDMSVSSYLEFVSKIKGIEPSQRGKRIQAVMERCSITEVKDKVIGRLSKGYQQRVGLAQALIHDPEIIILDEPTMGLDPKQIIEVRELIKGLGGDHTVVVSSHILPEVSMTCQRVVIINEGRVVAEDTPENLTAKLKGSESIYLEVEGPQEEVVKALKGMEGILEVKAEAKDGRGSFYLESELRKDIRRELSSLIVGKGWGLYEIRSRGMSLEEIFLHLTTKEEEV
jgi:ABC-2 type transport system ATP-binding protein